MHEAAQEQVELPPPSIYPGVQGFLLPGLCSSTEKVLNHGYCWRIACQAPGRGLVVTFPARLAVSRNPCKGGEGGFESPSPVKPDQRFSSLGTASGVLRGSPGRPCSKA